MNSACSGNNSVLVCGGAGYIGAHAVRSLRKHGYFPVVFDSLEKGYLAWAGRTGKALINSGPASTWWPRIF